MTDQNSQFFAILTAVGKAKQANADALGVPWTFAQMGVGDANNTEPMPSEQQTQLINERRRAPLNQLKVDPKNPNIIIAEQVIPESVGGWWIREIGLYDAAGDLVAVANCAPSFKPLLSQGSGRTQIVRMNLIVSNTANVELKIDPSVVLATRSYVDSKVLEELYKLDSKQSVRAATTGNIALTGLQSVDGVALEAGDRVLVKNQTLAKDNGLYTAAAGAWVRAADADSSAKVTSALTVAVEQGSALADTRWQLVTDGVIVLGTTALSFQDVTASFARLLSPGFMGNPTAPTPNQFDNSSSLVTTAFVKRAGVEYSNLSVVTGSATLTSSNVGGVVSAASATPISVTLPPTAGVPHGATLEVVSAGNGLVTVLPSGTDVLTTQGGLTVPVVMSLGDNAYFIKVTGEWRVRGGSISLKYASVFSGPNWVTQPLFDNSKAIATTEFVRRASGNYRGFTNVTDAATLTTGAAGTLVTLIGAFPVALPAAGDLPYGGAIHFRNIGNGVVNVVCSGTDFINAGNGNQLSNITLQPGATLELVSNGAASWWASGSAQLQYSKVNFTTAPQFDNSKAVATTEFVQKAIGGFGRVFSYGTGGQVIPPSQVNSHINLYGTCSTLTLPLISSVPVGSVIYIGTSSLLCTILRQGTDTIFLNSALPASVSITVNDGESVLFVSNGAHWIASGVAALRYSVSFAASFATTGYSKLPNGLVEQWGSATTSTSGDVEVTFPLAWTIMPLGIHVTPVLGQDVARPTVMMTTFRPATGLTRFSVGGFLNGTRIGESFFWRAIGKI